MTPSHPPLPATGARRAGPGPRQRAGWGASLWGLALVLMAVAPAGAQEQEEVVLRRFQDVVAVRQGPTSIERVLYYFSPTALLRVGDEVEQSGSSHSQVSLSAGGRVELFAPGHLIVQKLQAEGDVLRLVRLTQVKAISGDRVLTLVMPNGARCILDGGQVELLHEFGRLRVRNTGALPVIVRGSMELVPGVQASPKNLDKIVLGKGEEVRMPYFEEPEAQDYTETTDWSGLVVRHDADVEVQVTPGQLSVTGLGPADLKVAGVQTRLAAGQVLYIENKRATAVPAAPAESP